MHKTLQAIYLMLYKRWYKTAKNQKDKHELKSISLWLTDWFIQMQQTYIHIGWKNQK